MFTSKRTPDPVASRRRRIFSAVAPVIGLSTTLAADIMVMVGRGVTVYGVLIAVMGLAGLMTGVALLRVVVATERRITPEMATGHQVLCELVDAHHNNKPLVPPDTGVMIILGRQSSRSGALRELWRFDRDELTEAVAAGADDPVVFERFALASGRPLVWHSFDAIKAGPEGIRSPWAEPTRAQQIWRALRATVRVSDRTPLDMASETELSELIAQVQLATSS